MSIEEGTWIMLSYNRMKNPQWKSWLMNVFILPIEIFFEINRTQIQSTLTILGAQDGHFVCDSILFMEQGHRIDGYRLNFVYNKKFKYISKTLFNCFD